MSQQVQELIDKIKTEGIQEAGRKAQEIENDARAQAKKIIAQAQAQAKEMTDAAKSEAQKLRDATQIALKQSARDTVLALKKEIEKTLQRVVTREVGDALSCERLAGIISAVITKSLEQNLTDHDIRVAISADDLKVLGNGFMAKLQKQMKQPVKLQSSGDINKGLTISFDGGKSCFDFSDASLAQYLSSYLNDQTAALLRDAA